MWSGLGSGVKKQQDLEKGDWARVQGGWLLKYLWEGLEGKGKCVHLWMSGLLVKSPHNLEFPSGFA